MGTAPPARFNKILPRAPATPQPEHRQIKSAIITLTPRPIPQQPIVIRAFPRAKQMFPRLKRAFPGAKRAFPRVKHAFLRAKRAFPLLKRAFPRAKRAFARSIRAFVRAKRTFPRAIPAFLRGKHTILLGLSTSGATGTAADIPAEMRGCPRLLLRCRTNCDRSLVESAEFCAPSERFRV